MEKVSETFGSFTENLYLCSVKPIKTYKIMEKKYELIPSNGSWLFRVKALRDFSDVKKGDIGGYVESENNLSHDGHAWVYNDAMVFGDAKVYGNAKVYGKAWVHDNAEVFGNAKVYDNAGVYGNAKVYDNAEVFGIVSIRGNADICDNAKVYGDAKVYGNAWVCGDAVIETMSDYIVFKNWWSSGRYFTWTRSNNKWCVGCFYGTGKELIEKAYQDSEVSGREYERVVKYVESIIKT